MDKKQFKLQVIHNRFVRNAISTFCWFVISSIIYYFLVAFIAASVSSSSDTSAAYAFVGLLSIIFLAVTIAMVAGLIADNRRVREAEDEYFGESKVKVVYKYVERTKDADDAEDL